MGYYTGKKILIIGGTGTIGRGLCEELKQQKPEVIRIFSRDEYKQFYMAHELDDDKTFRFLIGDVRDYERVSRAMESIDIVFNLAAMKHVPACEYNPVEAIKTNVDGMENVISAAIANNVECVLFTSSDKAINPMNTYGATKMLGEKLVQAANFSKGDCRTRFVAVRFGNVMGSRGSVIPLFKKQIKEGKKITVTDPQMTRFMMTLTQAIKLIMTTCEYAIGGEVFILKMPIIKLDDLVRVIIEETCKETGANKNSVEVKTIGFRAGERDFEELMTLEESSQAFDLGDMYTVIPSNFYNEHHKFYQDMKKAVVGSYNSNNTKPITENELKKLLTDENLI